MVRELLTSKMLSIPSQVESFSGQKTHGIAQHGPVKDNVPFLAKCGSDLVAKRGLSVVSVCDKYRGKRY